MKVGIDVSALHNFSKGRGIGFYIENLIESLKKYSDVEVLIIESAGSSPKVDIIHYPFFDFFKPTLKIRGSIPTVVTIHDVIPLLFPKHYPPGIKGRINLFRQKQSLKKVNAVITDSETSTSDVIKVLKLPKEKVSTVYLASSSNFKKLSETEIKKNISKFNLPKKFLLYTGGVNWNKNLLSQTKAALNVGIDVVFVGGGFNNKDSLNHPEMQSFKTFLKEYENNPRTHILGFVTEDEIVSLMNAAHALLFASYYEGFGLPILEAQSCGTPVITSNNSSTKEVAGEGAILVNPDQVEEIEKAIIKIENGKIRSDLIEEGFKNLKSFSWEKTANQTLEIYNEVLK